MMTTTSLRNTLSNVMAMVVMTIAPTTTVAAQQTNQKINLPKIGRAHV